MSQKLIVTIERMTADDPRLDDKWAARVKYALSLPGAVAVPQGLSIACNTRSGAGEWQALLLPNGGTEFATSEDLKTAAAKIGVYCQ